MLMTILELGGAIIWTVYHVIEAGVKLLIPDKVDAIDIKEEVLSKILTTQHTS